LDDNVGICENFLSICNEVTAKLRKDCFLGSIDPEPGESTPRCSVGLVLNGMVIDDLVVGGPAFLTGQLEPGDVIVQANNQPITAENIHAALIGDDIPGSTITITVKKGQKIKQQQQTLTRAENPMWYLNSALSSEDGALPVNLRDKNPVDTPSAAMKEVVLTRMKSSLVAEKKRFFEQFTMIRVSLISTFLSLLDLYTVTHNFSIIFRMKLHVVKPLHRCVGEIL
jgi:hypothetical protein